MKTQDWNEYYTALSAGDLNDIPAADFDGAQNERPFDPEPVEQAEDLRGNLL